MNKTPVKFQKDQYKTVRGVVLTWYLLLAWNHAKKSVKNVKKVKKKKKKKKIKDSVKSACTSSDHDEDTCKISLEGRLKTVGGVALTRYLL